MTTKTRLHAELLNCLVAMQETLLYAARKVTLREAESAIVSLADQLDAALQDRVALAMRVEALTAERDKWKEAVHKWIVQNGRGGWIDDLRNSRSDAERFNFLCDCDNDQALDILCEALGKRDELIDLVDALIKERAAS